MINHGELISAEEFREKAARWVYANDRNAAVNGAESEEDFVFLYRLPENTDYEHFYSFADSNGDVSTMLSGRLEISAARSRSGEKAVLEFFRVLRTFTSTPDVAPEIMGYIIKNIE